MHSNDELLKDMLSTFRLEMSERILALSQHCGELEDLGAREPDLQTQEVQEERLQHISAILRELHNLKGAARATNLPSIEKLCHAVEGAVSKFKNKSLDAKDTGALVDLIYNSLALGDELLNRLNLGRDLDIPEMDAFLAALEEEGPNNNPVTLSEVNAVERPRYTSHIANYDPSGANSDSSIRISGKKLDELLAVSTELLVARLRMRQHLDSIAQLVANSQAWFRSWRGVRGSFGRLSQRAESTKGSAGDKDLRQLLSFVDLNQHRLKQLETDVTTLYSHFSRDISYLSFVTDQIQFETRRLRLIPLSILMEEMERALRQLSRELGKQVQLVVHGAELEVDKKLLDEIKAPLLHLIRNAIDHGIESPAQRLHTGKTASGTITISFRQTGREIELEVRDNGGGIDLQRVKELAVERGLASPEECRSLDDKTALQFIFLPGFSTCHEISNISGRGIGLDSVKEVATRLGGEIEVESWPNSGTAFRFKVPNVLVTAEGVLVRCGEQDYVLPVDTVERSFKLSEVETVTIGSRQYLLFNGKQILINQLSTVLQLPTSRCNKGLETYGVVLKSRGVYCAFTVDTLLRTQEVVIKNFSKPLLRVRHVSGATILADGTVALILNPDDLIKTATTRETDWPSLVKVSTPTEGTQRSLKPVSRQRVLVVDDSITTRTLEKNILEASGYQVEMARDGLEALGYLKAASYDLVITDMQMPQMDGTRLTTAIKTDQRLNDIPVIIVTSLDTPEDKTRGLEAGADAYLVKSRFDQQSLLNTIKQLI